MFETRRPAAIAASMLTGVLAALPAVLVADAAQAAGNVEAGRTKGYTCLGCHGVESYKNAYPTYYVPRIAGQHAEYIVAALKGYREGTRQHATMQANASTLSDEDMADIAAWLESLGKAP